MRTSTQDTRLALSLLPGPDTILRSLWSWVTLGCDNLLFRHCHSYRRHQSLKRLRLGVPLIPFK